MRKHGSSGEERKKVNFHIQFCTKAKRGRQIETQKNNKMILLEFTHKTQHLHCILITYILNGLPRNWTESVGNKYRIRFVSSSELGLNTQLTRITEK
jgi:hypothetical protein